MQETTRTICEQPLYDGGTGYAVPFDQFFRIGLRTDLYGLGADYVADTFWLGATRFQPTVGVRYVNMNEEFDFRGADSGLNYTLVSTAGCRSGKSTDPGVSSLSVAP
jgi:hypothetical protein